MDMTFFPAPLKGTVAAPASKSEAHRRMICAGLSQGETNPDEDEFLGLVRIPLDEAIAMVMRGEIRDSKTICGLMMAREVISAQKEQA